MQILDTTTIQCTPDTLIRNKNVSITGRLIGHLYEKTAFFRVVHLIIGIYCTILYAVFCLAPWPGQEYKHVCYLYAHLRFLSFYTVLYVLIKQQKSEGCYNITVLVFLLTLPEVLLSFSCPFDPLSLANGDVDPYK